MPWAAPAWRDEVDAWIAETLPGLGITPSGPVEEFRVRPWSAILRVPSSIGDLYFKALPPGLEHEVALSARLATWIPRVVLPVLAADERRGSMLLPDGGSRLHEASPRAGVEAVWMAILKDYARAQIDCAPHVEELLAQGVPDRRLARIPALLDRALEIAERMMLLSIEGFSEGEFTRLVELRPRLLTVVEKLASLGLPETLNHDDLHDRNVLMEGERPRIFDWGDACISHPFLTLRVALRNISERLGLRYEDDSPQLLPFRDAYLRPWKRYRPMPVLIRAHALSKPLAVMLPVLTWDLAMSNAAGPERDQTADFVTNLFRELLETPLSP